MNKFEKLLDGLTKAVGGYGQRERDENDLLKAIQRQQLFEKYRAWDDARFAARYISPLAQNLDTFKAEGGNVPDYFAAQIRAIQYDPEFQGLSPEKKQSIWSALRQAAQPYVQSAVNRGDLLEADSIQDALGLGKTTSDFALGLIAQDPNLLAAGQAQRGQTVRQNADGTFSTLNRLTGNTTAQSELYDNIRTGNVQNPQLATPWGIEYAGSEGNYRQQTRALNDAFTQQQRNNYIDDRAYAQQQRGLADSRAQEQHALTMQILDQLRNQGLVTQEAYNAGLQQAVQAAVPTPQQIAQGAPVPQIGGGTMDGSIPVPTSTTPPAAVQSAPLTPQRSQAALDYLSTHLRDISNNQPAVPPQRGNAIFNAGAYANLTPQQRAAMLQPVPFWQNQLIR